MDKKTLRDIDLTGKTVLVRVDFNVPLAAGRVVDDSRLRATTPTIEYLHARNAKIILVSHLGRPKGAVDDALRLAPVAVRLSDILSLPVATAPDCIGAPAATAVQALAPGDILLLENVRFHAGEEKNDPAFARELASLADVFVNDAFGAAHRAHASTAGVTAHLPSAAGLLMEKEIATLSSLLAGADRPFVAMIGGAKISTKIGVLTHLLNTIDVLAAGGGIANTLLKAQGRAVGKSLVEDDKLDVAREFLRQADRAGVTVLVPVDAVVGPVGDSQGAGSVVAIDRVPPNLMIGDMGPQTVAAIGTVLETAGTVLWNGPLGLFEEERFAGSTRALAHALAACGAVTIVGGGETVAAIEAAGVADRITHVSTGGGATLEFLEGKTLPGVAALDDA